MHLGWRWSSSGSGDRSIHRHHFHTTHTSHAHQAPCTAHLAPCTAQHAHFTSKPSTQPPLPQLLFLPCNAMACIDTLNPAPKPFQFHPNPYICLECQYKCKSKRIRKIMQEKSDKLELELGEREENFGHTAIYYFANLVKTRALGRSSKKGHGEQGEPPTRRGIWEGGSG